MASSSTKRYIQRKIESGVNKQLQKQRQMQNPIQSGPFKTKATNLANMFRKEEEEARQRGRTRGEEFLGRQFQGLDPQLRRSLEETANTQLQRDVANYQRTLAGQQGARGIAGGTAYTQQRDLANLGLQQQQQIQRDLAALDVEERQRNQAAQYGFEEGEAASQNLNRQRALDYLSGQKQEKRQKQFARRANRLFSKV